jgi:hypothetical protein
VGSQSPIPGHKWPPRGTQRPSATGVDTQRRVCRDRSRDKRRVRRPPPARQARTSGPIPGASPLSVGVLGPSVGLCPTFPKYVRVREGRGAHVCPSWRAKGWDLSRPHHMFICEVPVHGFHCGSRPDLADFVVRWARDAARRRRRMRSSASAVGVAVGVVREYRPAHGPGQVT